MSKNWIKGLSISAIILSIIAIGSSLFIMAERETSSEYHYKDLIRKHYQVFSPIIPKNISFCGEDIPLDNVFVREALDREITTIMYHHSSTFLILKRAKRYFPEIEKILSEEKLPEDLKYLAVAESGLSNAVSPAKAEGFWQFLAPTAKEYGMEISSDWDDRYDLSISTRNAGKYLRDKYSVFNNNWALACASYNAGERGVRDRLRDQGCNNYWELLTNSETSRYVYRIIAYKILMENPQEYGYYLREKDKYQPIPTRKIKIDSTINNLYEFAKTLEIPYLYLKKLNPALKNNQLINKTNKTYVLKLPLENSLSYKELIKEYKNEKLYFLSQP